MSTKIYNAYRFKGTAAQLMPFLKAVREDIEDDTVSFYREHRDESVETSAYKLAMLFKEAADKMAFEFNVSSSVMVFFHDGEIYLQFYYPGHWGRSNKRYPDTVWSEWIEDFHYQNQSDQPEDVPESDWERRRRVWDEILGDYGIPSRAGLMYEMNNPLIVVASKILDKTR